MIRPPSDLPNKYIQNVLEDVFNLEFHEEVEQSAIYRDIHFHGIDDKSCGIVLTAQCDIQNSTGGSFVLVARVAPAAEVLYYILSKKGYPDDEIIGKAPIMPGDNKSTRKNIVGEFGGKYIKNKTPAYYYLPPLDAVLPHSLVCCEMTECIAIKDLETESKLCILRSPFREAVPAHFSAYIGRVGVPEFPEGYCKTAAGEICKLRDR